jgi:orotate phosphoribosyltransferase
MLVLMSSLPMLRESLIEVLRQRAHEHRDTPFQLSSGEWSYDYIDGKRALAAGPDLRLAAEAVLAVATDARVSFDAVGGLTLGADPIAHAVALISDLQWFSVRKNRKPHGKQRLIEGAELGPGTSVLLVDDVVTFGTSITTALDAIEAAGARVVLAIALMDRGNATNQLMRIRNIPYQPLATYHDLGIQPVGDGLVEARTSSE